MALDETIGGASADTYATLAEFQAYAAKFGWSLTATTAQQEEYLRRAAVYLDTAYTYVGFKVTKAQALVWPRYTRALIDGWYILSDEIPQVIKDAQCEMAWLMHGGADPYATVTSGAVKRSKSKAGPVETETEYASPRELPRYPSIGKLLRYVITGGEGSGRMVRG